jgi:hypothetical protein
MVWKTILIVAAVILAIYLLVWLFSSNATTLSSMQDASKETIISADKLPAAGTNNYTYSIWFFVKDWNYRYGEEKVVLGRAGSSSGAAGMATTLGAIENNLKVSLECYPSSSGSSGASVMHDCIVDNVPIQRWVNLLISVNGRTVDVYLDGKLTRTCVLPGVAKINPGSSVHVTPGGGFSGFTSQAKYWPNSTNPQEAYDIYREGFGGSILGNLLGKYKIKVAFMEDGVESGSFQI